MTWNERPIDDRPMTAEELLDLADRRPAWMAEAECSTERALAFAREVGFTSASDLFVPNPGVGRRPLVRIHAAQILCGDCRVRSTCLTYALEHHPVLGTWGGLSLKERNAMKKEGHRT
jgi:WhiB family redox-sensing transcriptional regulator